MTVTDTTKTGTMPDSEGAKTPSDKGGTPETERGVSSDKGEQPLYTQSQADALIHAVRSDWGRKLKDIEVERDNLKTQVGTVQSSLDEIQSERDNLQQQIEDLSSNDPQKYDLVKKDKDLRDKQRQLKGRISELDDRETKLGEREGKVSSFEREVLVESIADEYEDGDSAKLKKAVEAFDKPTEEQIRTMAGIIFSGKTAGGETAAKKPLKADSGKSRGGSTYFTRTQIADRGFWEANREAILEAQKEGRIRDE